MPIWSEILVLSLGAYALGIGAGWLLWGTDISAPEQSTGPKRLDESDE